MQKKDQTTKQKKTGAIGAFIKGAAKAATSPEVKKQVKELKKSTKNLLDSFHLLKIHTVS